MKRKQLTLASILLLTVLILGICPFTVTAADGKADFSLSPSAGSVTVGDVFTVDIILDARAQPVGGISAFLDFDPDYL